MKPDDRGECSRICRVIDIQPAAVAGIFRVSISVTVEDFALNCVAGRTAAVRGRLGHQAGVAECRHGQ
jgi:hypothetical protein